MSKKKIAIGLFVVIGIFGCMDFLDGRNPTPYEEEILTFAKNDWEKKFGKFDSFCRQEFRELQIIEIDSLMELQGGYCSPDADACFWRQCDLFTWQGTIIYTDDVMGDVRWLLFHEFAHFGSYCAFGDTDSEHVRKIVWQTWLSEVYESYLTQEMQMEM